VKVRDENPVRVAVMPDERPTVKDVIASIRQLPEKELAALMSVLPVLSRELCPDLALVSLKDALHDIEHLKQMCRDLAASKPGPKTRSLRLRILALAEMMYASGKTWPQVYKSITPLLEQHLTRCPKNASLLEQSISRVRNKKEFRDAMRYALEMRANLIIEKFIERGSTSSGQS
jgi:hypothetical protein